MCKTMIYFYFQHLRIYIVLNESVFIIVTDVIHAALGSITRFFYMKPSFLGVRPRFWPKFKKLAKKLEASNCLQGRKLGYFQDKN